MIRTLAALAVTVALATTPVAKAASEAPLIRIDVSEVPEAEDVRSEIESQVLPLLREHGISPEDVRIKIIWLNANDLVAGIYASVDPEVDPLSRVVVSCPDKGEQFCPPPKLPGYVRIAVQRAIAEREEAKSGAAVPPVPADTTRDDPSDPSSEGQDPKVAPTETADAKPRDHEDDGARPAKKKLGGMGFTGIAGLVLGAGALGTGAAFIAMGETRPLPEDQSQIRDFSVPGYALIGVGGALVVVGAVLLAVDRSRAMRRARSTSLVPSATPRFVNLTLSGRF